MKQAFSWLAKALRVLGKRLYQQQTYVIYGRPIDAHAAPLPLERHEVSFAKLENIRAEHFDAFKRINRSLRRDDFDKDVKANHECFVGRRADTAEIVFYVWTRTSASRDAQAGIAPAYVMTDPKEVHFFSAYTDPDHRGLAIYPAGIRYLERYYGEAGYAKLTCSVTVINRPALNALRKLEFRPTGWQVKATRWLFIRSRKVTGDAPA